MCAHLHVRVPGNLVLFHQSTISLTGKDEEPKRTLPFILQKCQHLAYALLVWNDCIAIGKSMLHDFDECAECIW